MLTLDHVALIVRDLEACASSLRDLGIPLGAVEEVEADNTREVYIEIAPVTLLLMQPRSQAGPIARHVARRGPGFHHLAYRTPDARTVLENLREWFACPATFRNLKRGGPAWLVRPDLGLLLEIMSAPAEVVSKGPPLFRNVCVEVPDPKRARRRLEDIGAYDERWMLLRPGQGRIRHVELEAGGRRFLLDSFGALSFSG